MKIIIVDNYEEMSRYAYDFVKKAIQDKNNATLGLATGGTPLGLYKEMIKGYKQGDIDFKNIQTFNLDEYVGLPKDDSHSYAYFMQNNLFKDINIKQQNINIENGMADNLAIECKRYNDLLLNNEIDLQILGIGSNGHIAFNEPGTPFDSITHTVNLAENTIKDNARFFNDIEAVPKQALTMGIKNIMNAKKIIVLANGENKADAVAKMVNGEITNNVPASVLQLHPDCVLIVDKFASKYIQ